MAIPLRQHVEQLRRFWAIDLWKVDTARLPRHRRWLIEAARLIYAVGQDVVEGQLTLRAMGLVYTTLLTLVPLLAVSFSVLKAFGVHNQIEPALMNFLAPLGAKAAEITNRVIEFVENIKAGVLGAVGVGLLFYFVIALIQKIEVTFNYIWHVGQNRPFARRFSDYLSVLLIGPVLVFSALGLTATITSTTVVQYIASIEPFGTLIELTTRMIPYVLIIVAFTFVYIFVPNTKVLVRHALTAGLIAGVLWQSAGVAFATFVVNSTKYTAIYSGFATVIVFMIWVYVSWLVLLIGADIAFYRQHPEHLTAERRSATLSNRVKELVALAAMSEITRRYYAGRPPPGHELLAQRCAAPPAALEHIVAGLQRAGLVRLAAAGDQRGNATGFLPAVPPEQTSLAAVLNAVRSADEAPQLTIERLTLPQSVLELGTRLENAVDSSLGQKTLKDLALADPAGTAPASSDDD